MHKAEPQYAIQERFLDQPYTLAGRLIDPVSGMLSWQGKCEHLRRKELEILALLASSDGKQVSRDNFIAVVWQGNDLVGDRGLSNTIVFVRKSLRDDDAAHPVIRTIPRRGYQLAVPVQQPPESAVTQALVHVEAVFAPGGMIPECPGWRLVKRLSQSAVNDSWLAEPSEFGERDQSLRVFRFCRSEAHLQRLRREVTLLRYLRDALLDNQHFALIQDWQLDEPPYYLARDYATFGTLSQWGGLTDAPLAQRMAMMQGLCDAVAAMHALGVVHRQLHADTILVDSAESGPRLKVSAFDLAALSDRSKLEPLKITALGLTQGVEDLSCVELTAADDIYALGTVLLQLALGDLQAQPNAEWLIKITNPKLQTLLNACFGLSTARPSAAELAAQLRSMNAPESTAPALNTPATAAPPETLAPKAKSPSTPVPVNMPEAIGNYRLLDRLGEGGMGSVYLAEQREPYRQVALKIIRSGLDGQQILSRFEAERQALALMNHPNVTTVLDSGLAADGRPFFAMEYVKGDEITQYCDAHHLNLSARIRLFLQVCDGVLHAHQKGVLHRDIKPSNLMVSQAAESAGTVKIIDFGLAKSLHGKLAAHTLHTSFGAFIGTPVYCSPEHISGSAGGVDTRSDIYSMGVVLYELLAGTTPIATESLENLEPEKVRELVCKSKLPSMCEQLQKTTAEKRSAIAEHRSIKLDELPKTLEGDLSWVVGKCLERDPNDRYASVLELKKDLVRWLELRPVEARPTTSWYRFRKLVRRNRGTTLLVSLGLSLLIATTAAAVVGFLNAERAARLARNAADQAQQMLNFQQRQWEQLDAESMGIRLRERLNDAINQSMPVETMASLAPTHMLDQLNFTDLVILQLRDDYFETALKTMEQDYAQRPELQHYLRQSMAEALQTLGIHDRALQVQELALRQRQTLFGPDAELSLQSLFHRGQILSGLTLEVAARADFEKVYETLAVKHPSDHPAVVLARFSAAAYNSAPADQVRVYRETLGQRLASHGTEDLWVHRMRIALARALTICNQYSQALAVLKDQASGAPQLSRTARQRQVETLQVMGYIARRSGDIFAATGYYKRALDTAIEVYGSAHTTTSQTANFLAIVLMYSGRAAEAEALLRKSLANWRSIHGADNPRTIWFDSIIADAAWMQGRLQEATAQMGRCTKRMSPTHSMWFPIAVYHGMYLRDIGELEAARAVLQEAIETTKDPKNRIWGQNELGRLEHIAGNLQRAEQLLSASLAALQAEASNSASLAALQAEAPNSTSLAALQAEASNVSFHEGWANTYLGGVWKDMGKVDQARRLLESTWPKVKPWEAHVPLQTLALLEHEQGNRFKALALAQKAVALGRKHHDPRSLEWTRLKATLARIESSR